MSTSLRRLGTAIRAELATHFAAETGVPWHLDSNRLLVPFESSTRACITMEFMPGPHARPVGTSWDYVAQFGPKEFGYRFYAQVALESDLISETSVRLFGGPEAGSAFAIRDTALLYRSFLKATPLTQVTLAESPACRAALQPLVAEAMALLHQTDSLWKAAEDLVESGDWQINDLGRISLAFLSRGAEAARIRTQDVITNLKEIEVRTGRPRNSELFQRCLDVLSSLP